MKCKLHAFGIATCGSESYAGQNPTQQNFVRKPGFRHTGYINFIIINYSPHFINLMHYTSSIRIEGVGRRHFRVGIGVRLL